MPQTMPQAVNQDLAQRFCPGRYLDTGESIYDRNANVTGVASTTQTLSLMGFKALKSETITRVQVYTAGTAAGATPTLCRIGIYVRKPSDNSWGLAAAIANDTTLFAAANTTYTRTLTTTFNKVAGYDYAVGMLIVSAAAFPTFVAPHANASTGFLTDAMLAQPLSFGKVITQADLATSYTNANVVASALGHFHCLLLN